MKLVMLCLMDVSTTLYLAIIILFVSSSISSSDEYNIVFFHLRKASGSTIWQWMKQYQTLLQTEYDITINAYHVEAYSYVHAKLLHFADYPDDDNRNVIYRASKYFNKSNTLFITAFRNPIDRIISHYNFEWRWGCIGKFSQCNYTQSLYLPLQKNKKKLKHGNSFKMINDERNVSKSAKYKFSNILLSDIIYRVEQTEIIENKHKQHRKSIFMNNYYLWLFCCDHSLCSNKFYIKNNDTTIENWRINCLQTAKDKIINDIDIVLITEWLSDIRSAIFVNKKIKEMVKRDDIKLLMPTHTRLHVYDDGDRENHKIQMISKDAYRKLMEWNKLDLQFYQYVKEVSYDRLDLNK